MKQTPLSGMFRDWYIEYASYVILERAVPHIEDGLKPVQRRILHTMKTLDDGRFNKVANIVGSTMSYHPHGDASIGDALVQLGQKQLLVDTQGNWGNILTGDGAAAPRYIEARLSEFAVETAFSPKITQWTKSYDGRKDEPVTLPMKFPLLLAQGVEGIAVALSSRILPHNFNEIIDAAVDCLHGRQFRLLPDFPTGGLMDASKYNDGARGGSVRIRAKIEKLDAKTLVITELPFGKTTETLIASILSAMEKGKIKISKVDDNTSSEARIVIHLPSQSSSDKTIDALYAFTDCEVSISSNCCVIRDKRPEFLSVTELLEDSVRRTVDILRRELEIRLDEARESRLFASLEKIFIEERMYKDQQIEQAPDMETAIRRVDVLLDPFKPSFFREINDDDLIRLWEIKMGRILKFNSAKADERIARLDEEIGRISYDLEHMVDTTERWYLHLKEKYGDRFPRLTTLRSFDSIEATKVAEANRRLYWDRDGGFIGTSLKDNEFLFPCSDIDDILVIYRDGKYKIVRVADKLFIDRKVIYIGLYKKRDERTVYNLIYRNGKGGNSYMKRCFITGLTREKEYNLTKGLAGSRVEWLTANPNGEAETVRVTLYDEPNGSGRRPRHTELSIDFARQAIKGKESLGNLVTKYKIKNVSLEKRGSSTLGGREVWFDRDVLRLNYDGRGESLGIFQGDDKVLVIGRDGTFFTSSYAETNHYEDNILRIEKFDPEKVWTLVLFDNALGYPYMKRFQFEAAPKPQRFVGGDEGGEMLLLTDQRRPFVTLEFADDDRPPLGVDAEEFIGVKSYKAKGKRLTLNEVSAVSSEDLAPEQPEEEEPAPATDAEPLEVALSADDAGQSQPDTGQPTLFDFDD